MKSNGRFYWGLGLFFVLAIAGILDSYKLSRLITEVQKHRATKTTEWQFDI